MPPVAQASLKPELNSSTHIHQIYIKAEPGQIWDHITSPEFNGKYGYGGVSHYDLKPGGKFRCIANEQMRSFGLPEVIVDGEVIEVKPPFKLVQTYRFRSTRNTGRKDSRASPSRSNKLRAVSAVSPLRTTRRARR